MTKVSSDKELLQYGSQRCFGAEANEAGVLIGGIGTGTFTIGQRGQFKDWELFNTAGKGNYLPNTFFAIRIEEEGEESISRVLESKIMPPYNKSHGFKDYEIGGLPRFDKSTMKGEYPFVYVDLEDERIPMDVTLEAFNPLIPLNADDSGIPVGIIKYKVKNNSNKKMDVSVVGSLANMTILKEYDHHTWDYYQTADNPVNEYKEEDGVKGLFFRPEKNTSEDFYYGTMSLMTDAKKVSYKHAWLNGGWWNGLQDMWDDFTKDGKLESESTYTQKDVTGESPRNIGSLVINETILPGEEKVFQFFIGWYFPNRVKYWTKELYDNVVRKDKEQGYPFIKNYYSTKFESAWQVGYYTIKNLRRLEYETRLFHDAFFNSTIPSYVLDAVSSTLTVIRSNTCFRLEDGALMAFEGCFDDEGCCEGNCTHVWNYAQSMAFLFPELEQSMRRLEYKVETEEDGKMNFRSYKVWGMGGHDHPPAADGQMGTFVRLYRDWKISGDNEFLKELWPMAKKTLDFGIKYWDKDNDLITETDQFNTYDIMFQGPNSLTNSLFYAALKAGIEMARFMGDEKNAKNYEEMWQKGNKAMDELLWSGEYYVQHVEDINEYRYQYGEGCLSDQLFGQMLAHISGLGYVLPKDHVKKAIKSVFDNNFITSAREHHNTQRTYILNDESGLLLCTWPKGGRPRFPFPYSDEVWTGIEYQVATHLIFEGFVKEGLTIVKSVRDRHDGIRRNPWDEVECGHHYARSLASYGVLLALCNFKYDLTQNEISFNPAINEDNFSCFFSIGKAWGLLKAKKDENGKIVKWIEILYGDKNSIKLVEK